MKTLIKKGSKFIIAICLICAIIILSVYVVLYSTGEKVKFDRDKIFEQNLSIEFYDGSNVLIREENHFNDAHIKLDSIPDYIPQAFISIEDKSFYNHNGLNYKRIGKAALNNMKSLKIKEGASTISQQLVKNTHLSSEKSYRRKLNEMIITKQMEKLVSKKDILESYLNIIYFGNGCYGIENASKYYFSKSAKQLQLDEAAMLAGIIKSPYNYSPLLNPKRCIERRNLVLREMYRDKKITFEKLNESVAKPINLKINESVKNKLNTYSEMALDEAIDILKMPAKQIAISGFKIYTYLDNHKQSQLQNIINKYNLSSDYACCNVDSKTGAVEAYVAKSAYKINDNPRQPGSTIKPILVYSPALEEGKIAPLTKINDEEININGYAPQNVGNVFHGYVSIQESVEKSLNIPAVKCLSYVGIEKAKHYAKNCGINFTDNDNGYALALGGMTKGITPVELATAYSVLANSGKKQDSKFVKYITDSSGKIVYMHKTNVKNVFRDDTAYLMNKMLLSASKKGTSKILKDCDYQVASKTGTVGIKGKKVNLDAWNVAYTTDDILVIWLGNMDNTPVEHSGSKTPVMITKDYLDSIYIKNSPKDFIRPSSIQIVDVDTIEYENNNQIMQANDFTPTRYKMEAEFSKFNLPKSKSTNFINIQAPHLVGSIENDTAILSFEAENYFTYELYKQYNNKTELVEIISGKEGQITVKDNIKDKNIYSYYLISKLKNFTNNTEIISEKSNVIQLLKSKDGVIINHDTTNNKEKWYI